MKISKYVLGITGITIGIIHALAVSTAFILIKLKIIRYDNADFAYAFIMLFSPLISITGIIFSLFGIILKNKKLICIIGIIINGIILVLIIIFWLVFIFFMMSLSGSSLFTD